MNASNIKFIKENYSIVNKLFAEGNKELAQELLEVTNKIGAAYTTPVCPTCKQPITDPESQDFMFAVGECIRCDHVRGGL